MIRVIFLVLLLGSGQLMAQKPDPREVTRLRVLLVADTDSNLGDSVRVDQRRLGELLSRHVPEKRFTLTTLQGKDVTRAQILRHFHELKTGPDEGIVLYFAGHGGIDRKRGHYLQMQPEDGPALLRSELRKAMEDTGAGLVVILTDCCSSMIDLKLPKMESRDLAMAKRLEAMPAPPVMPPTVRELFFRARGVVDITGCAPGAISWGDDEQGGVFSRVFADIVTQPISGLDLDRDGRLTWEEVFPYIQLRTQWTFLKWKSGLARGHGARVRETTQKPHAYQLGGRTTRRD